MPSDASTHDIASTESSETFTERDVLLALAVRSLTDPNEFNARQFQDELTALGFSGILEEAQELIEIAELEKSVGEELDEKTLVDAASAVE